MVNYFKELENPNDNYLDLVWTYSDYNSYEAKHRIPERIDLPILDEYLDKIIVLINKIKSYDLLNDNHLEVKPIYLDDSRETWDYNMLYYAYINYHDTSVSNLTEYGVDLLNCIKYSYEKNYKGLDFVHDFERYYYTFMDYLKFHTHFEPIYDEFSGEIVGSRLDSGILKDKYDIKEYLFLSYKMAKYQNKITEDDKKLFGDVFNYFENNKFIFKKKDYVHYKYHIPNAWYITPFGHLYNSAGGHGVATLMHPWIKLCADYENRKINKTSSAINFNEVESPFEISYEKYRELKNSDKLDVDLSVFIDCGYDNLLEAKEALENGYITYSDWHHYVHLIPSFASIKPLEYENMSEEDKGWYDWMGRRTYNPKIVKYVAGIMSANAGLLTKFQYLRNISNDYVRDFEFLHDLGFDSILIQFCGFHKISSIADKTITTSDVNWENNFKEYIEKGWHIDFVKPILLNNGKLEELNDEFLKVKKYHI